MDSIACFHTPSKDKLLDLNPQKKYAGNCIMKIIVLKEKDADSLIISETNPAFTNSQGKCMFSDDGCRFSHTKKIDVSVSCFLTL